MKEMPLAMKGQINNQKSKPSQTQNKAGLHWKNLAALLFLTAKLQSLLRTILGHGSWWLSQICNACAAAFAVEI